MLRVLSRSWRRHGGLLLGAALLTASLSACSEEERAPQAGPTTSTSPSPSTSSTSATASASPTAYLPAPEGVTLTEPGTELAVGEQATIAWQPKQAVTGFLDATVTSLVSTSFEQSFKGWQIDQATASKAPFFVTATLRNAGETDLGGRDVPLYAATDANTLVEASAFSQEFQPCRPGALPSPFPPGGTVDVCLVYLLPAGSKLVGVSFRPTEEFEPILWTGPVTPIAVAGQGKKGQRGPVTPVPAPAPTPAPTTSPTGSVTPSPSPS